MGLSWKYQQVSVVSRTLPRITNHPFKHWKPPSSKTQAAMCSVRRVGGR